MIVSKIKKLFEKFVKSINYKLYTYIHVKSSNGALNNVNASIKVVINPICLTFILLLSNTFRLKMLQTPTQITLVKIIKNLYKETNYKAFLLNCGAIYLLF